MYTLNGLAASCAPSAPDTFHPCAVPCNAGPGRAGPGSVCLRRPDCRTAVEERGGLLAEVLDAVGEPDESALGAVLLGREDLVLLEVGLRVRCPLQKHAALEPHGNRRDTCRREARKGAPLRRRKGGVTPCRVHPTKVLLADAR